MRMRQTNNRVCGCKRGLALWPKQSTVFPVFVIPVPIPVIVIPPRKKGVLFLKHNDNKPIVL